MPECDQRVQLLLSVQLGDECSELGCSPLVVQLNERDPALQPQTTLLVGVPCELERGSVEVERRLVCPTAARCVGGCEQVRNRAAGLARLTPVMRKDGRDAARCVREELLDVARRRGVALPPSRPGEALRTRRPESACA